MGENNSTDQADYITWARICKHVKEIKIPL
jgi:hypothetical protein